MLSSRTRAENAMLRTSLCACSIPPLLAPGRVRFPGDALAPGARACGGELVPRHDAPSAAERGFAVSEYVVDWLSLAFRWAHVVAGVAWVGAMLYMLRLEDLLRPPADPAERRRGTAGELWFLELGSLFAARKVSAGSRELPAADDVRVFAHEAYAAWATGLVMLAIVYWAHASTLLIDPYVHPMTAPVAIAFSIGALVAGWLVYDVLFRTLGQRPRLFWSAFGVFLLVLDYALFRLFTGRAAALQLGAVLATIMAANAAHVVARAHRTTLASMRAGRRIDARTAGAARTRAMHNTYFALPVIALMLSNHAAVLYASPNAWLGTALVCAAGVLVRHFFVLSHGGRYVVMLPAAAIAAFALAAAIATPRIPVVTYPAATTTPAAERSAVVGVVPYAAIGPIIAQRCAVCHAAKPRQPGLTSAPAGVRLDTPPLVAANAARIESVAVAPRAMPPGNVTGMTDGERATLGAWIAGGARL